MSDMERPAHYVVIYHDTKTEAAVDSRGHQVIGKSDDTIAAFARSLLDDYWTTATIDKGVIVREEVEPGVWLQHFEEARPMVRWYVGPDWVDGPEVVA